MIIGDKGGRGKSHLLKRLQFKCKYEFRPPVPACLVALDQLADTSKFGLVMEIREEFRGVSFPKFDRLNYACLDNNFDAFTNIDPTLSARITDQTIIDRVKLVNVSPPGA
jgi:hypothetical protein